MMYGIVKRMILTNSGPTVCSHSRQRYSILLSLLSFFLSSPFLLQKPSPSNLTQTDKIEPETHLLSPLRL